MTIPSRDKLILLIGTPLLLAVVALMHSIYFTPVLNGVDPNGYHAGGRMIEESGWPGRPTDDPYRFLGRMWVISPQGEAFPKYPPFYPAMIAAARHVGGPALSYVINPIAGTLAVAGAIALGATMGLGGWSLIVGLLIWLCPVLLQHTHSQTSHATSMALIAWGMACGFGGAARLPRRGGLLACTVAGLLIGCSAGIRYTNVLLALPLLVGVWVYATGRRERIHALLGAAGGLALPWLLLGGFHWIAYGAPWRTGYAMTAEQGGFSLAAAWRNWPLYSVGFVDALLGPALALSFIGIGFMLRQSRRDLPVILAWVLPLPLLYLFYYWAPAKNSIGYMRFVLPVALPLAIAAADGLRLITRTWGRRGMTLAVALLLAAQLPWAVARCLPALEGRARSDRLQRARTDAVLANVTPGNVVIGPMGLLNTLDAEADYILYPDEIFSRNKLQRMGINRSDEAPHGLQFERVRQLQALLLEVELPTYHKRLKELLDGHQAAGRSVHFVTTDRRATPDRLELGRLYSFGAAVTVTNSITNSLVFEPRTGSRAADAPPPSTTATYVGIWPLTGRRAKTPTTAERIKALEGRHADLQAGRSKEDRKYAAEFHQLRRSIESLQRKQKRAKR